MFLQKWWSTRCLSRKKKWYKQDTVWSLSFRNKSYCTSHLSVNLFRSWCSCHFLSSSPTPNKTLTLRSTHTHTHTELPQAAGHSADAASWLEQGEDKQQMVPLGKDGTQCGKKLPASLPRAAATRRETGRLNVRHQRHDGEKLNSFIACLRYCISPQSVTFTSAVRRNICLYPLQPPATFPTGSLKLAGFPSCLQTTHRHREQH